MLAVRKGRKTDAKEVAAKEVTAKNLPVVVDATKEGSVAAKDVPAVVVDARKEGLD